VTDCSVGLSDRRVHYLVLEIKTQAEYETVDLRFVRPAALGLASGRVGAAYVCIGHGTPCPSAIEAHELGAVRVENPRHKIPFILVFRKNHDHKASGAHILDMMSKVRRFLNRPSQSNQCSLELCEEAVFGSARIESMHVILTVEDIDVFSVNARLKQGFDCRASTLSIRDGADNSVRRVADEIARDVFSGDHVS
jgi:hypothetical protein